MIIIIIVILWETSSIVNLPWKSRDDIDNIWENSSIVNLPWKSRDNIMRDL